MFRFRASSILKSLGVAVFLAFVMQMAVVEAEHFGLFDCEAISAFLNPDNKDTQNVPTESHHISCCGHVLGVFPSFPQSVLILPHARNVFVLVDERAPDGPVLAIDYPPQLS